VPVTLRRLAPLLALWALLALAVPAGARTPTEVGPRHVLGLGIADNKPAMFTDPEFRRLHIHKARIVVPWDVMMERWSRTAFDAWMRAARRAHVRPLVTFGHSRRPGLRRMLPTSRRMYHEFRKIHRAYPWAREFATWNEPNHCGEPTCNKPELVAHYYRVLRKACPRCTILGSEVLDMPNMERWVRRFLKAAHRQPAIWGLHNYIDANRLRTKGTRRLLHVVKGRVWFTETGGIVNRRNPNKVGGFEESPAHAAVAVRWVFDRLAALSPRVTRVYLYNWSADTDDDWWDSALLGPAGEPRPAFSVLEKVLETQALVRERVEQARKARKARRAR
jgi:hypothetical protein